jgi:endoglucanase
MNFVESWGRLQVKGTKIVNEKGQEVQLKGISTHGIVEFERFVNKEAFQTWKDFGANCIRLAMYTDPNEGYTKAAHDIMRKGVSYVTELGMYVIIDWHILAEKDPMSTLDGAMEFFQDMSMEFKDQKNVLYEICNEPNGDDVTWTGNVKPYAQKVIPVIRNNDKKAIIIVGTPTWSQDVDIVAKDPIKGYDNIMYTLHFYAATHKKELQDKMVTALEAGLPLFVSEYGVCDASGDGCNDFDSSNYWVELMNKYGLSYLAWNLSNKAEAAAMILPECDKVSGWTMDELTESGKWVAKMLSK